MRGDEARVVRVNHAEQFIGREVLVLNHVGECLKHLALHRVEPFRPLVDQKVPLASQLVGVQGILILLEGNVACEALIKQKREPFDLGGAHH